MTLISDIEDAIITKLEPLKAELNCAITKLDKQALSRPRSGNEVFVNYEGRNPSSRQFVNPAIVQLDEIDFEIMTTVTDLRTHEMAYPILERVRALLTGLRPVADTIDAFYMVGREKLLKNFIDDGVWAYSQIFRMTHQYTQSENL